MGWLFSSRSEEKQFVSEKQKEQALLEELPEDLGKFLKLENRKHFKFIEKEVDEDFPRFFEQNPPKSIPMKNCADYQASYMNCLSNGTAAERRSLCSEYEHEFHKCWQFQDRLLKELGIFETQSKKKYLNIEGSADELGQEWLSQIPGKTVKDVKIPDSVLDKIYDKRDEIWK